MMASTHIYDVSGVRRLCQLQMCECECPNLIQVSTILLFSLFFKAMAGRKAGGGQESQGVEVALAPEELELDPMAMTQKYEEHVREQQAQVEKEDFSDMVAEHAAKQKVQRHRISVIELT